MDTKEYHKQYREKNREKRRVWNREWIKKNRDRYNSSKYLYRDRLKRKVLLHYGNGKIECVKCGFDNIDALCLDHIDNNGAEHRKSLGISGRGYGGGCNIYQALLKHGFPPGLQVLCANCNTIKEIERKRSLRLRNKYYKDARNTNTL